MLSRFVRDDANQTRNHFFYGSLLILLSLAIGSSLVGYSWQSHSVLGSQTIAQGLQTGTGDSQDSGAGTSGSAGSGGAQQDGVQRDDGQIQIIDQPQPTQIPVIQQPTSAPQPTLIQVQPTSIPQPTPTPIIVGSIPELIDGADPQTEIVIRNEDNTLIVSTTTDPTHVAIVESGESLSGQLPPSTPSSTSDTPSNAGVIETVLTYNPTTREYDEVPVADADSGSAALPSTSTFDSITNSVIKVFSQETYFPSNSPATQKVINMNTASNFAVYDWLTKYQFKIFPIGSSHLAIYRNGITTLTRFPIVLGLSRQSLGVLIDGKYKAVLHYPDTTFERAADNRWVSADGNDEAITLTDEDGELIYRIEASSEQLFFAFYKVSVCRILKISADSEELREISTCSTKDAILEALSISL